MKGKDEMKTMKGKDKMKTIVITLLLSLSLQSYAVGQNGPYSSWKASSQKTASKQKPQTQQQNEQQTDSKTILNTFDPDQVLEYIQKQEKEYQKSQKQQNQRPYFGAVTSSKRSPKRLYYIGPLNLKPISPLFPLKHYFAEKIEEKVGIGETVREATNRAVLKCMVHKCKEWEKIDSETIYELSKTNNLNYFLATVYSQSFSDVIRDLKLLDKINFSEKYKNLFNNSCRETALEYKNSYINSQGLYAINYSCLGFYTDLSSVFEK